MWLLIAFILLLKVVSCGPEQCFFSYFVAIWLCFDGGASAVLVQEVIKGRKSSWNHMCLTGSLFSLIYGKLWPLILEQSRLFSFEVWISAAELTKCERTRIPGLFTNYWQNRCFSCVISKICPSSIKSVLISTLCSRKQKKSPTSSVRCGSVGSLRAPPGRGRRGEVGC